MGLIWLAVPTVAILLAWGQWDSMAKEPQWTLKGTKPGERKFFNMTKREGVYWLDFTEKGKRVRKSLGTYNKVEARKRRREYMDWYEAEQRKKMK